MDNPNEFKKMGRRRFLRTTTAAGASLVLAPRLVAQMRGGRGPEDINVALIGAGDQGHTLLTTCLRIDGVRFKAVCDIWGAFNLKRASRMLKAYGHDNNAYVDYREMLDREKGNIDAAIVATPDFRHAEHTIACLDAGLHVYCEAPMSNTLAAARRMVQAARRTGRLLQIGHQRRSNPRHIFCREKLLRELVLLGQIVAVNGQWNRMVRPPRGWPRGSDIDPPTLQRYGYKSMGHFRDWRWYKGLGSGPVINRGAHQIDVYNWFLDAHPASVSASASMSFGRRYGFEWPDTAMVVYEYATSEGPVCASYQVLSVNSSFQHFEAFLGTKGTLVMSELARLGEAYPEPLIDRSIWDRWAQKGYLRPLHDLRPAERDFAWPMYRVDETPPPPFKQLPYKLPVRMEKPYHQPHLENFFDTIRGNAALACPAKVGYAMAVTVLKINQAIEAGRRLSFKPEDFICP